MSVTLADVIESAAGSDSDRYGFRFLDRHEEASWLPFAQFRRRVATTAGALLDSGIRRGERVAIVLPTCPEFIELFFAAQWIGAIPVALYPPLRLGRLGEYHERTSAMLKAAGAAVLYTDSRIGRILGETAARYRPRLGVRSVAGLRDGREAAAAPSRADQIAMIQFSSGTTTDPKPVALSHSQMLANGQRITDAILHLLPPELGHDPGGVSWLPLYHDMGLIGCLLPALLGPGPLTLIPPEHFLARPAIWLRAISRYRGTTSPAPNFAYSLSVDRIRDEELEGCDLACWRMAMNGAEPMAAATLRAFERRFSRWGFRDDALMPVYGLSEATLAVTFTRPGTRWRSERFDTARIALGIVQPDPDGSEWVSCGEPLPGFAVRIRNDAGGHVGENRVGRIQVRGPSVMSGYFGRDDAPIDAEGWLDTGDLGFLRDGRLYVTGRAKDLLVLRGHNLAPEDLERAVDAVPGVRTGCAAAVAEIGESGERLLLFVEARQARDGMAEECRRAVMAACSVSPDEVLVLEPGTLPRTSSGKIRRGETLRLARSGELRAPAAVNARTLGGAMLRSAVGYVRSRLGAGQDDT
ncbi:MAG TPA: fatty acyl-AMP ligase [Candidatus Binatia bacterium]|jgi:acyl-CoA synthetase (AMP-forming)/AMP-acid ligase II